ncbi:HNH endonuclease signature motif containing protein [Aquisphaera insulae]|uniref:HNH endonuclease signature motif containing protein n=1 Tax=Aquisphaera insulae TaxID=2712864 RepID=UPI0013EC9A31|nr:HNH endonuclease signature motif containing protein [Aquisphaera insulae]
MSTSVTITVRPIGCPTAPTAPIADPGRCRTREQWQHARQISRRQPWGALTPGAQRRFIELAAAAAAAAGDAPDACHLWPTRRTAGGYAIARGPRVNLIASRVAWSHIHGEIPPGHEIDHVCGNPLCINIKHLECVTVAENRRRRGERLRSGAPSLVDPAARERQRAAQQRYRDHATALRSPEEWARIARDKRDRMAHASRVRLDRLRRHRDEGDQPQPPAA